MSDEQSSDDQIERILPEAKDGLRASGTDRKTNGDGLRMRDGGGANSRAPRGPRIRNDPVARWVAPAGAAVVIMLVIGVLMFVSQGDRLRALEGRVEALHDNGNLASSVGELHSRIQELNARVEKLGARIETAGNTDADIKAVKQLVADQAVQIKSLSQRLTELEHKASSTRNPAAAQSTRPTSRSAKSSSAHGWVVNLISVADIASAERFEQRLKAMGVHTRLDEVDVGGKSLRRVVATGFDSKDEARKFAAKAKRELSLPEEPWVSQD